MSTEDEGFECPHTTDQSHKVAHGTEYCETSCFNEGCKYLKTCEAYRERKRRERDEKINKEDKGIRKEPKENGRWERKGN